GGFVKLAVGQRANRSGRIIGLPDDGRLIPSLCQMPVEAVRRQVERAVIEPADSETRFVEAGVLDPGERPDPIDPPRLLAPKAVGVLDGAAILVLICCFVDQRVFCPLRWNWMDF